MAPVYLYEHSKNTEFCQNEFEISQPIKEDAFTKCPFCGNQVRRLIAGGVYHKFKGGSPTPRHYG